MLVRKRDTFEALRFDDLVAHGVAQGVPLTNGMPWSFTYANHPITHENDDCYLIVTPRGDGGRFNRGEILVNEDGRLHAMDALQFAARFEPAHAYDLGQRDVLNAILALNPKVAESLHRVQQPVGTPFDNVEGKLPFDVVFWVTSVAEQLNIKPKADPADPLCSGCGKPIEAGDNQWFCDEVEGQWHGPCFNDTACGREEHGEGCPTLMVSDAA